MKDFPLNSIVALSIATLAVMCSCGKEWDDSYELIDVVQNDKYKFEAEYHIEAGALGSGHLYINKYLKKEFDSSTFSGLIIQCSSLYSNASMKILGDKLLLVRLYTASVVANPDLILSLDQSHDLIKFGPANVARRWNRIKSSKNNMYTAKLYRSPTNEKDFSIRMWLNKRINSSKDFYLFGANSVNFTFINDRVLKIIARFPRIEGPVKFYLLMWEGTYGEVEIYYDSLPNSLAN